MAREDGPISFLLERQLQEIIGEESPQQILDGLLDPDNPINWGYAGGHPIGGSNLPAARIDRNFTASATTLGNVIGVNYGARGNRLAGLCGLVYRVNYPPRVYVAFFFSIGELPTSPFANIKVSDEDITALPWVLNYETHVGSSSQAISTILNTAMASKGFVERYPGMAYIVLELNGASADLPNSLTVTADVKGRKVFDYRTSTWAESSNPALTMYDILTFDEVWLSKTASDIDTGVSSTWNDAADHFDTVMADTTKRYEFNGLIVERDPLKALQMVGRHAFAEVHYRHDKLILKTLANRTPASTFIDSGDWVKISKGREIPAQTIGNQIIIGYTVGGTFTKSSDVIEPTAGVTNEIPVEEYFAGCYSKSHARRLGEKMRNHTEQERRQWNGQLPEAIVADVIPGDVIQAKFPEYDGAYTAVRVESLQEGDKGITSISLTEYGATTDSTATVAEDGTVDQGVLTNTEAPDTPTACDQVFGERGNWEDKSIFPDPSALTSANGWVSVYGTPTVSYVSGPPDYTQLESSASPFAWDWWYQFDPGSSEYLLLTFCWRIEDQDLASTKMQAWYTSGSSWPPLNLEWMRDILTVDDGQWFRTFGLIKINTSASVHAFRFAASKVGATSSMKVRIRRLHGIMLASIVDLRREVLQLYERWEWTEASGADDTVAFYQAIRQRGVNVQVLAETPQGESSLEFFVAGQGPAISGVPIGGRAAGTSPNSIIAQMSTLGLNGQRADFPAPTTQTWEEDSGVTRSPEVPLRRAKATAAAKYELCTLADGDTCFIEHDGFYNGTPFKQGRANICLHNDGGTIGFTWNLIGNLEDASWIQAYDTGTDIVVWIAEANGGHISRFRGYHRKDSGIELELKPPLTSGTPTGTLVFDASDVESYAPGNMGWVDKLYEIDATSRGGSKDPEFNLFQDNGSGSQGVFGWDFSYLNEWEVYVNFGVPDDYRDGTDIDPVVIWSNKSAEVSSYSVKFGLECTKANVGSAFPTTSFVYATDTDIFTPALEHRRIAMTSISGTGLTGQAFIKTRLFRDVSVTNNYAEAVTIHAINFRMFVDKMGAPTG